MLTFAFASSCSFGRVKPPPLRAPESDQKVDCTTSYTWPTLDTLGIVGSLGMAVAGAFLLKAGVDMVRGVHGGDPDGCTVGALCYFRGGFAILGGSTFSAAGLAGALVGAASAAHGYSSVSRCRDMNAPVRAMSWHQNRDAAPDREYRAFSMQPGETRSRCDDACARDPICTRSRYINPKDDRSAKCILFGAMARGANPR
jgi:hypothetical protein